MKRSSIVYLVLVASAGLVLLGVVTILEWPALVSILPYLLFLAVLGAIAESQAVMIGEDKAITVAFANSLCALVLFGPAGTAWVLFLSVLGAVIKVQPGVYRHLFNTPLYKTLFNASNYVLTVMASGTVYGLLGGEPLHPLGIREAAAVFAFLARNLPAIVAAILAFILVNTGLLAVYFALEAGKGAFRQWLSVFRWSIPSLLGIGCLGLILVVMFQSFGLVAVVLFFGPLMLARYTFVLYSSLKRGYLDTIKAMAAAIEAKDCYTIGHSRRVEEYCMMVAEQMRLPAGRMETLKYAALLHDVGKIGISEAILNKPGRLTTAEYAEIRRHPEIGFRMLEEIDFLKDAVHIIKTHHVHYDGTGYPAHADAGGEILESRIICVADAYDAMTSDRPYRKAMSEEAALSELRRCAGRQFDPAVVDAFIHALDARHGHVRPIPHGAPREGANPT